MVGQHAGKQVATLLRSLGSVQAVLQAVAQTAAKLSTATELEAIEVGPGAPWSGRQPARASPASP